MKEFVLIFRLDIVTEKAKPTEEQMRDRMQQWMEWIDFIGEEGQLSDGGNRFSSQGKVLKPDNIVTESPYVTENQAVMGYIIILAKNMEDAAAIAGKCPILKGENTSVEIRELEMQRM